MKPGALRSNAEILFAYCLLTIAFTWPLAPNLATHLPGGSGDLWQNLWNFWWWKTALLDLGVSPFHTPYLFHPYGASLVFHTHSAFNQVVALPINIAIGPIAAYNFSILLGIALAGLGAFHLAFELTHDRRAAFVAGFIFAFFPHHLEQTLEHTNLSTIQFLPWVTLYALRIARGGSRRDGILFGLFFGLNAISCFHYGIFTLFVLPWVWLAELIRGDRRIERARAFIQRLLLGGGVAAIVMVPVLWPMAQEILEGSRYVKTSPEKGIDLAFLFLPSDHHPILGALTDSYYREHRGYKSAGFLSYVGYSVLLLAGLGIARARSVRAVLPWVIVLATSLVLALGAHPRVGGQVSDLTFPHAAFSSIPILQTLRTANRFIVLTMLATSVLAAMGLKYLHGKWRPASLLMFALIAFEYLWLPYPVQKVAFSPILDELASEAKGAVLDIPFSTHALYRLNLAYQTRHQRPIAGGYVSVAPRETAALEADPVLGPLLGLDPTVPDRIDVEHLRTLGFSHVVMHKNHTREWLEAGLMALDPNASGYQRKAYNPNGGMPAALFEEISRRFVDATGPPIAEDEEIRVFRLTE